MNKTKPAPKLDRDALESAYTANYVSRATELRQLLAVHDYGKIAADAALRIRREESRLSA